MTTRVLLTGVSGVGKSATLAALTARGYHGVDLDEPGLSEVVAVSGDELTGLGGGRDWVWKEERVDELLERQPEDGTIFLSGCSPNQGRFYDRLEHVVLLTAPPDVIVERLATRTGNPFGKRPDEVARVLELQRTIEPVLSVGACLEVVTTSPMDDVITTILAHVGAAAGVRGR